MLRRVARTLRMLLFAVGVISFLVWIPSFRFGAHLISPVPGSYSIIDIAHGSVAVGIADDHPWHRRGNFDASIHRLPPTYYGTQHLWPTMWQFSVTNETGGARIIQHRVTIPLWLLAAVCLAWPVTSFIVARRRRRRSRGFEVGAAGSTPLPPGEVDAERSGADGEGGQQ